MKVVHGLLIGCGALVGIAAVTGTFTLNRVRAVNATLYREVTLEGAAADYQRGATKLRMAAQMHTLGNKGSDLIRREGLLMMAEARAALAGGAEDPRVHAQLAEMERVERLTVNAAESLFKNEGDAANIDPRVAQRLNFVEARAEALSIGLETFAERRREHVQTSLRSMHETQRIVTGAIAGSVALALLIALLLARRISVPIRRLSRGVSELGAGNFAHVIDLDSHDEMGDFARGFNVMTGKLRDMMGRLERRNHDMSRVLDNVAQGLVTIDPAGVMSSERSLAVTQWFGPAQPAQTLWDCLAPFNAVTAATFKINWEAVVDDILPRELTMSQLPKQLTWNERTWEFGYRVIGEGGAVAGLLVVITDVTERLVAEQAEAEQRAFVALIERMLRDRDGVIEFINEANHLVAGITRSTDVSPVLLRRQLHTLKGGAAIFGLLPVAQLCHRLEDSLAEDGQSGLGDVDRAALLACWKHWTERFAVFLNDGNSRSFAMRDCEYDEMLLAMIRNAPRGRLAEMLARLRLEPARIRLLRLGEQVSAIAARLAKPPVRVTIEDNAVRLPGDDWRSFWSALVHVVRNSVDHGIEKPDERLACGKEANGSVELRTQHQAGNVLIEIVDDGRGIDWQKVARKASENGLPSKTAAELTRALFVDGFSTADAVSDVSGRGVGLAAVRAECEILGGSVEVESVLGRGTTFRFILPAPVLESVEPRLRLMEQAS